MQLDVVPQFLQDAEVAVAEDESARAAGATDGDTGQPHAAAQLQNRPADRRSEKDLRDGSMGGPIRAAVLKLGVVVDQRKNTEW